MKKKILAAVMAATMVFSLVACGSSDAGSSAATGSAATDTASAGATSTDASGDLIKVGIINNDPNESGYRTANDKDMKNTFTEANGYEASFAYSLKNDEQITAAQKFIQDGVDSASVRSRYRRLGFRIEGCTGCRYQSYPLRPYH